MNLFASSESASAIHTPTSSSAKIDSQTVFQDLEQKVESLSLNAIASLVETVQLNIKNNHVRLLGLQKVNAGGNLDIERLKREIEKENHYLAGTVLPMLYKKVGA